MRLFAGIEDLRVPGERAALWGCTLAAPLTIAAISAIFPTISFSEFVLLIVGGMVFVSISRGRLLGSSIRISDRQIPELAELVETIAAKLGMEPPQIFIRDDPFVPIAAAGIGSPYALVLSSQYYEHLRPGELAFLIARELAHIAAGHTRIASLLSATGRENPVVAVAFGAWLRRTEYTADRVGLLCCANFDDAMGAISISTFHAIGRRVDMRVLADQRRDLAAEPTLRMGEWLASTPFATNRLDALHRFDESQLARTWRAALAAGPPESTHALAETTPSEAVTRRECAPLPRRAVAIAIDIAVIGAIFKTPLGVTISKTASKTSLSSVPAALRPIVHDLPVLALSSGSAPALLVFFAYSALLVAVSGQTLGMMVMELRVVTTHYARPTLVQAIWRYAAALLSSLFLIACAGFFVRVHPHDRVSATRVIGGRNVKRRMRGKSVS